MTSLLKQLFKFRLRNPITIQIGGIEENYGIGRVVKGSIQFNDTSGSRVEAVTNVIVRVYKPNGIGVAPSLFVAPTAVELDDTNTVGLFTFEVQLPSTFDETLRGSWIVYVTGDAGGQSPAATVGFAVSEFDTDLLKLELDKLDATVKSFGLTEEDRTHLLRIPSEGEVGIGAVAVEINFVENGRPEPDVLAQIKSQTTSEVLFSRADVNGTLIVNLDPGNYFFTFFRNAGKFVQRRTVPTGVTIINFDSLIQF